MATLGACQGSCPTLSLILLIRLTPFYCSLTFGHPIKYQVAPLFRITLALGSIFELAAIVATLISVIAKDLNILMF